MKSSYVFPFDSLTAARHQGNPSSEPPRRLAIAYAYPCLSHPTLIVGRKVGSALIPKAP